MTGSAVLLGATDPGGGVGGGVGAALTTPVALLVAETDPPAFDAVTVTRRVLPTAEEPSVFCAPVLPSMETQLAPAVSHRFHWYA